MFFLFDTRPSTLITAEKHSCLACHYSTMVIAPHSRACQGLPTGVRLLLQNEEVKLVSQTRLLGIVIDDSLSWSPHVDSICRKSAAKLVLYVVHTGN